MGRTTATYDSVSFSVNSQSTTPFSLSFSDNGEYFYILDGNTKNAYQYNLSTAWDVSTTSYSGNSVSIGGSAVGLDITNSGTLAYVCSTNTVTKYELSTAYDISTASATADSVTLATSSRFAQSLDSGRYIALVNGSEGGLRNTATQVEYPNQMDKTQLDAVPDANHFTLGNDLDLAVIFNLSSGTTVPSSDGVSINIDANSLQQGAVLGTDYNFDFPATDKVRITSLAAQNLKTRII